MREEVLYEIFMYLHKEYDTIDRDMYLGTLCGYRVRHRKWYLYMIHNY